MVAIGVIPGRKGLTGLTPKQTDHRTRALALPMGEAPFLDGFETIVQILQTSHWTSMYLCLFLRRLYRTLSGRRENAPAWNNDRRELWNGKQLCKRYRQLAGNQITILRAFEEEEWPHRIDDPLSGKAGKDHKRRLRDTVRSMNDGLKHLRFECDGTGEGIIWSEAP